MPVASTSAATAVVAAGSGSVGPPPPALATWQFVIYDRDNVALADITTVCTSKRITQRLSRPGSASFSVPSNDALVSTVHTDGFPILTVGRRCLKVRHRASTSSPWVIKFNGIIWSLEDMGGEGQSDTTVTAFDPLMWFKFRLVLENSGGPNGDFSTPTFVGRGPATAQISGGDLIQQMVENSNAVDGDIGLDTTRGVYSINAPPAYDMTAALIDFPITMADMLHTLTSAGGTDVYIDPVDDGSGLGSRKMGILNAVNQAGSTSVVHFDYGMGDYSIQSIRRSMDIDGLCNKLWYYLGPSLDVNDATTGDILVKRWRGNITGDDHPTTTAVGVNAINSATFNVVSTVNFDDGPTNDPALSPPGTFYYAGVAVSYSAKTAAAFTGCSAHPATTGGEAVTGGLPEPPYTALIADRALSRTAFGVAMDVHIHDNEGVESDPGPRQMWRRLWTIESSLRQQPREMLFVTPVGDAPFDANALRLGDIITINASSTLRSGFAAQQRLYGWDIEISDENVSQFTQLVTSADAD